MRGWGYRWSKVITFGFILGWGIPSFADDLEASWLTTHPPFEKLFESLAGQAAVKDEPVEFTAAYNEAALYLGVKVAGEWPKKLRPNRDLFRGDHLVLSFKGETSTLFQVVVNVSGDRVVGRRTQRESPFVPDRQSAVQLTIRVATSGVEMSMAIPFPAVGLTGAGSLLVLAQWVEGGQTHSTGWHQVRWLARPSHTEEDHSKLPEEPHPTWLGVQLGDGKVKKSTTGGGVHISKVVEGGPAEAAGFQDGDFITKVEGKTVKGRDELIRTIRGNMPGNRLQFQLMRNEKPETRWVTLVARN